MTTIAKFASLIKRQKESGLSVRSFCSNEGIAPSTFYYWKKKIRKQSGGERFIPLVIKSPAATYNPISPREKIQRQGGDMFLEITYPSGISLKIKNDMDLSGLRALISLLD